MQFITILKINPKHSLLDPFILSLSESFTVEPAAEAIIHVALESSRSIAKRKCIFNRV